MSNPRGGARKSAARAAPYGIVGAASAYLYYTAAQIEYSARAGMLGPDFWPRLILALTIAVCLYEVVKIFVLGQSREIEGVLGGMIDGAAPDAGHHAPPDAASATRHPWRLAAGIAITVAYVATVHRLGFFITTVLYLAAFIAIGGYRRWRVTAAVSILGTLVIVFFFMKVVYVSLPLGRGPFQQVSVWLMQMLGVR